MKQIGTVIETNQNTAKIRVLPTSSCGNCKSCDGCAGRETVIEAQNRISAKAGDRVIVELADGRVLSAAFVVYIAPIVLALAGYLLGGIWVLTIGIALSITVIVIYNKKFSQHKSSITGYANEDKQ